MVGRHWDWSRTREFMDRLAAVLRSAGPGMLVRAFVEGLAEEGTWPLVAFYWAREGRLTLEAGRGPSREVFEGLARHLSSTASWPHVERRGRCVCLEVAGWTSLGKEVREALEEFQVRTLAVWRTQLEGLGDGLMVVGCRADPGEFETGVEALELALKLLEFGTCARRRGSEEAELLRSQAKYKVLFESAGDAIFLMEGSKFVDANERAAEMFGAPREELVGREPYAFSPERQPDGRPSQEKAIEKIRAAHEAPQRFEWRHKRLDGTEFDAEVSLNRVDLDGKPHLLAVVRDVTDKKIAQGALRLANYRLRVLSEFQRALLRLQEPSECAAEALERLSELVRVPVCGAAECWSQSRECRVLAVRTQDQTLKPGPRLRLPKHYLDRLAAGDVVWTQEPSEILDRVPGLPSFVRSHVRKLLLVPMIASGTMMGFLSLGLAEDSRVGAEDLAIVADVGSQLALALAHARVRQELANRRSALEALVRERTAELERRIEDVDRLNRDMEILVEDLRETNRRLERAMKSLQEANEDLEAFVSSISHDLQAPLRAVKGFGQALMEDFADHLPEEGRRHLIRILEAAEHMSRMIEGLLEYARISQAAATLAPVPLEPLLQEALQAVRAEAEGRSAEITVEGPMPRVLGHGQVIVQILANLLSNAIKFVPEDRTPRVRVWTQDKEGYAWVHVEDNGVGIPESEQERIFRVFEKLHPVSVYPGTGMGLALVRRGVERIGGRISVESRVGEGSRFSVGFRKAMVRTPAPAERAGAGT